jgi:hypothetical protein
VIYSPGGFEGEREVADAAIETDEAMSRGGIIMSNDYRDEVMPEESGSITFNCLTVPPTFYLIVSGTDTSPSSATSLWG